MSDADQPATTTSLNCLPVLAPSDPLNFQCYIPCNILGCSQLTHCLPGDDPMHLSCKEHFWEGVTDAY